MNKSLDKSGPGRFILWSIAFFATMPWIEVSAMVIGLVILVSILKGFDQT